MLPPPGAKRFAENGRLTAEVELQRIEAEQQDLNQKRQYWQGERSAWTNMVKEIERLENLAAAEAAEGNPS